MAVIEDLRTKPVDAATLEPLDEPLTTRELGFPINPHLFRHLAATLYLSEYPGQYEVVRSVLGHSRTSSTIAVYAGFEPETAARLYAGVLADIATR